jgi:hypothetical protein
MRTCLARDRREAPSLREPDREHDHRHEVEQEELIWLALRNVMKNRSRSVREWISAMNQFALMYPDRFTARVA